MGTTCYIHPPTPFMKSNEKGEKREKERATATRKNLIVKVKCSYKRESNGRRKKGVGLSYFSLTS